MIKISIPVNWPQASNEKHGYPIRIYCVCVCGLYMCSCHSLAIVKAMVFPVVMYGCESWTIKQAKGRRIDAFELWCWRRLLRVPWTARRSNQSILKEISPEYTLEADAQAEAPILCPTDVKSWLTGNNPDARKVWRWEEKGTTEDEMVRWHHRLDGHDFEQAPGAGDGQESLVCCSSWGRKESDTTEWLNWTELNWREHLMWG